MNSDNTNKIFDELIKGAIGREGLKFDFNKWKHIHKKEVQIYKSQTTKQKKHPARIYRIGKIIMKSKITKFTAVAAVLIIFLGLFYFPGNSGKVYGMMDVPNLFYSADTVHIKARIYFPQIQTLEDTSVETEYWLDLAAGRWRTITANMSGGPQGFDVNLSEYICEGGEYGLIMDQKNKKASFVKLSDFQKKLFNHRNLYTILQYICSNPEKLFEYKKTEQETIDGQIYQVWEAEFSLLSNGLDVKVQSWISSKTGDYEKTIIWMRNQGQDWKKQGEIYLIERNIPLGDEIFSLEIPSDYTSTNTKETAQYRPVKSSGGGVGNFRLWTHLSFVLPDGSLVLCWSSEDTQNTNSQHELFDGLTIGGAFPKLPFQIDALSTNYKGETITYKGHHLLYTKKDNKFYEWGVYASDKKISPEYAQLLNYHLVYSNNQQIGEGAFSIGISSDIWIRDKEEFDELFTEAIKELSDNDTKLPVLNYDEVMRLAKEFPK